MMSYGDSKGDVEISSITLTSKINIAVSYSKRLLQCQVMTVLSAQTKKHHRRSYRHSLVCRSLTMK